MARTATAQMIRVLGVIVALVGLLAPSPLQAAPQKSTSSTTATRPPAPAAKKSYNAAAARARRARVARARAAARAREAARRRRRASRPTSSASRCPTSAAAAIIYNPVTREVLWESNAEDERSIASITKVMTALVVLESGMDLTEPVKIVRSDVARASTTYLASATP